MRIDLARLDAQQLQLQLEHPGDDHSPRILVAEASGLKGALEQSPGQLLLQDVLCERAVLDALLLRLGSVLLHAAAGGELKGVAASYQSTDGRVTLHVTADRLQARGLHVELPTLSVRGDVVLRGASLTVDQSVGMLSAEGLELREFQLALAGQTVGAPELTATRVVMGWGGEVGFHLSAKTAEAPALSVDASAGTQARCSSVELSELSISGPGVGLTAGNIERIELLHEPEERKAGSEEPKGPKAKPATPLFDFQLLDGLAGQVNVDVLVSVSVPVIGRRKGRHRVRAAVRDGAIDYRRLEHDLAALEDALLDFSVRDSSLVLELGIPLLPTRGHGKPLVRWPLDDSDRKLAEQGIVRLAVLPQAQLPKKADDASDAKQRSDKSKESSFQLRSLAAEDIDVNLRLAPSAARLPACVRQLALAELKLAGRVQHKREDDADGPGHITGVLRGLQTELSQLPMGTSALSCLHATTETVNLVRAELEGTKLTKLSLTLERLGLRRLRVGPTEEPASVA